MRVRSPSRHHHFVSDDANFEVVRYTITDELWKSFTVEQVNKQMARLRETGRFRAPNNGGPFVVRVSYYALTGETRFSGVHDALAEQGMPVRPNDGDIQSFYDFRFNGEADAMTLTTTQLLRFRRPGSLRWTPQQRQEHERTLAESIVQGDCMFETHGPRPVYEVVNTIWWERDFVCVRCSPTQAECNAWRNIAEMAFYVVAILLQDRTTHRVEIEPSTRPKLKLNFLRRRPAIPDAENFREIVLTIPRRVYTGEHGGTHASPRMHYRAEHVRQQPHGPRSAPLYREIVIEGTWINASDIDPADLGTPIRRNYKLKG